MFLFLPHFVLGFYSLLLLISLRLIFYLIFLPPRLRLLVFQLIPSFFLSLNFFFSLSCIFHYLASSFLFLDLNNISAFVSYFFYLLLLSTSSPPPTLSKFPSSASFSSQVFPTASPHFSKRTKLQQTAKLCCKLYHLTV